MIQSWPFGGYSDSNFNVHILSVNVTAVIDNQYDRSRIFYDPTHIKFAI